MEHARTALAEKETIIHAGGRGQSEPVRYAALSLLQNRALLPD